MFEKIIKIWQSVSGDVKMFTGDIGISFLSIITVQQLMSDIVHTAIAVTGTLIGGCLLFLFQKTILPVLAEKINNKIINWFNKK